MAFALAAAGRQTLALRTESHHPAVPCQAQPPQTARRCTCRSLHTPQSTVLCVLRRAAAAVRALRHAQAALEVVHHAQQALAEGHLWLPAEQLLGLGDVGPDTGEDE